MTKGNLSDHLLAAIKEGSLEAHKILLSLLYQTLSQILSQRSKKRRDGHDDYYDGDGMNGEGENESAQGFLNVTINNLIYLFKSVGVCPDNSNFTRQIQLITKQFCTILENIHLDASGNRGEAHGPDFYALAAHFLAYTREEGAKPSAMQPTAPQHTLYTLIIKYYSARGCNEEIMITILECTNNPVQIAMIAQRSNGLEQNSKNFIHTLFSAHKSKENGSLRFRLNKIVDMVECTLREHCSLHSFDQCEISEYLLDLLNGMITLPSLEEKGEKVRGKSLVAAENGSNGAIISTNSNEYLDALMVIHDHLTFGQKDESLNYPSITINIFASIIRINIIAKSSARQIPQTDPKNWILKNIQATLLQSIQKSRVWLAGWRYFIELLIDFVGVDVLESVLVGFVGGDKFGGDNDKSRMFSDISLILSCANKACGKENARADCRENASGGESMRLPGLWKIFCSRATSSSFNAKAMPQINEKNKSAFTQASSPPSSHQIIIDTWKSSAYRPDMLNGEICNIIPSAIQFDGFRSMAPINTDDVSFSTNAIEGLKSVFCYNYNPHWPCSQEYKATLSLLYTRLSIKIKSFSNDKPAKLDRDSLSPTMQPHQQNGMEITQDKDKTDDPHPIYDLWGHLKWIFEVFAGLCHKCHFLGIIGFPQIFNDYSLASAWIKFGGDIKHVWLCIELLRAWLQPRWDLDKSGQEKNTLGALLTMDRDRFHTVKTTFFIAKCLRMDIDSTAIISNHRDRDFFTIDARGFALILPHIPAICSVGEADLHFLCKEALSKHTLPNLHLSKFFQSLHRKHFNIKTIVAIANISKPYSSNNSLMQKFVDLFDKFCVDCILRNGGDALTHFMSENVQVADCSWLLDRLTAILVITMAANNASFDTIHYYDHARMQFEDLSKTSVLLSWIFSLLLAMAKDPKSHTHYLTTYTLKATMISDKRAYANMLSCIFNSAGHCLEDETLKIIVASLFSLEGKNLDKQLEQALDQRTMLLSICDDDFDNLLVEGIELDDDEDDKNLVKVEFSNQPIECIDYSFNSLLSTTLSKFTCTVNMQKHVSEMNLAQDGSEDYSLLVSGLSRYDSVYSYDLFIV